MRAYEVTYSAGRCTVTLYFKTGQIISTFRLIGILLFVGQLTIGLRSAQLPRIRPSTTDLTGQTRDLYRTELHAVPER